MALDGIGVALLVMGVFLFIFEMIHPGAFLLVPGSVLLAGAFLYIFLPGYLIGSVFGPLLIVAAALVAAVVSIPIYRRLAPVHRPMVSNPTSLEGRIGIVTVPVLPDSMSGKVQVDSEVWSARADMAIPTGEKVRVIGGQGVCVLVRPVNGETVSSNPGGVL